MNDALFPSGPWTGFYTYEPANRHRMDLELTFTAGQMRGEGVDDVGPFLIHGGYDAGTLECNWVKTYPGRHAVYYHGFREGKGIWGRWDIGTLSHGGFHIWPKATGADAGSSQAEAREERALAPALAGATTAV